ncbi:MAG: 23S rRNA (guanosine(2251)-2'-O)-methyltransferase RlmB [Thermodesulfobacteriota bacterium]
MEKRIIYGINPVREAISAGKQIELILVSRKRQNGAGSGTGASGATGAAGKIITEAKEKGIRIETIEANELKKKTGTEKHQGLAAVMAKGFIYSQIEEIITAWKNSNECAFILILDSIEDPQNMGTLIRSAEALGVHGIIIPKDRSTSVTATVTKASAGATEHTLIHMATNINNAIKKLKDEGVWIVGLTGESKESITEADLNMDIALVIGSEAKGIRRLVKENCDRCLSIPMFGKIGSLNAAQAGTIALYEARKQRAERNSNE